MMAKSHRPLRFIHSVRTNCGRGYSGCAFVGDTSLAQAVSIGLLTARGAWEDCRARGYARGAHAAAKTSRMVAAARLIISILHRRQELERWPDYSRVRVEKPATSHSPRHGRTCHLEL